MPTSESRAMVARRRQARAEAMWAPDQKVDRSWMRFVRCKGCGMKLCINNTPDHSVDLSTIKKAGGLIGLKKGTRFILCWRCKRFSKMFNDLIRRMKGGDGRAKQMWDSYPATPYPGEA